MSAATRLAFVRCFMAVAAACLSPAFTNAQPDSVAFHKTVTRIEAGIPVMDETRNRWNRTVLLAKPRISSGDTEALAGFIQDSVSKFVLTILATVDEMPATESSALKNSPDNGPGSDASSQNGNSKQQSLRRFRLAEVGVGHSVQVGHRLIVIRPDDYQAHGARLSFLERQMLSENQRQFADIRTVARMSTLLMFDVPALLRNNGQNQEFDMRHLVWIDSKTGQLFTLIWLLHPNGSQASQPSGGSQVVSSVPLCWWDSQQIEDRAIHVDKAQFTLGIPGKRAFALEKMPAARAIQWNSAALELAGLRQYDADSLRTLLQALNQANQDALHKD
jgi:hypothetical protein